MKTIVINASPRKRWNTAQILKSAYEGAKSVGADVEYIDLYDIDLKGCMSCLVCKSKKTEKVKCYWRDDLSPIIERILEADTLLVGSPIYFGKPTSHFRALMERLIFCILSYDDYGSYYKGKLNVGLFYTMNAPEDVYNEGIAFYFKEEDGSPLKFTYPYACDGLIETKTNNNKMLKLLMEYKFNYDFTNRVARAKVITQALFYIKRFEID